MVLLALEIAKYWGLVVVAVVAIAGSEFGCSPMRLTPPFIIHSTYCIFSSIYLSYPPILSSLADSPLHLTFFLQLISYSISLHRPCQKPSYH